MERPAEKLVRLMMVFSAAAVVALACNRRCGHMEIPYPFGMKEGCYLNKNLSITCNKTHDPPKAILGDNIDITNISIIHGELHILQSVARDCYRPDGSNYYNNRILKIPMFTISHTKNKFTVIGCNTLAHISGQLEGVSYKTGCMAICGNSIRTIRDGSCSGNGCCQLEIPKGLKDLRLEVCSFENHTKVINFNHCGYASVIQQDKFTFSSIYIRNFTQEEVPLVLDWAIPTTTCSTATNKTNCICGPNSKKINFLNDGTEYRCQCLEGFEGNPYLPQGCHKASKRVCERKRGGAAHHEGGGYGIGGAATNAG